LEREFHLNKKFQQKNEMIQKFNLVVYRKISDFTAIEVDETFFFAKLYKKKDTINNDRRIKGLCFFKLRFRKSEIILQKFL
jgi:hypothetical protein